MLNVYTNESDKDIITAIKAEAKKRGWSLSKTIMSILKGEIKL